MHTMRPGPHAFGGFDDPAYLAEDVLSTEEVYYAIAKALEKKTNVSIRSETLLSFWNQPLLLRTLQPERVGPRDLIAPSVAPRR